MEKKSYYKESGIYDIWVLTTDEELKNGSLRAYTINIKGKAVKTTTNDLSPRFEKVEENDVPDYIREIFEAKING